MPQSSPDSRPREWVQWVAAFGFCIGLMLLVYFGLTAA